MSKLGGLLAICVSFFGVPELFIIFTVCELDCNVYAVKVRAPNEPPNNFLEHLMPVETFKQIDTNAPTTAGRMGVAWYCACMHSLN